MDVTYDGFKFVNVYYTDSGYGGPEEGGWYYDTGSLDSSYPVKGTEDEVRARLHEVQEIVDKRNEDEGNHKPSSVLCNGWLACWIEDHPGKSYPEHRPYYE